MAEALRVNVRVVPRAAKDAIEVTGEGSLRVRLRAPPVDGRANEALLDLLAHALDLPARAVTLIAGERSRTKVVELQGVTWPEVEAKLRGA